MGYKNCTSFWLAWEIIPMKKRNIFNFSNFFCNPLFWRKTYLICLVPRFALDVVVEQNENEEKNLSAMCLMAIKTSQSHNQDIWKQRQLTTRKTKVVLSVFTDNCHSRRKKCLHCTDGHENQSVSQPEHLETETAHHWEDKSSLICYDWQLSLKKYWFLGLKFDKNVDGLADNSACFYYDICWFSQVSEMPTF